MNQPGEIDEVTAVWLKDLRRSWGHGGPMSWQADAADHFERQARELAALKAGPSDAETTRLAARLRPTLRGTNYHCLPCDISDAAADKMIELARSHAAQAVELAEWRTATGCGNQTQVKALLDELRQDAREEQDRADKAEEQLRLEREQHEATKLQVGLQEASIESLKIYAEQGERRGFSGAVQALREIERIGKTQNWLVTSRENEIYRAFMQVVIATYSGANLVGQVADYLERLQPQPATIDPLAKLREAKARLVQWCSENPLRSWSVGYIRGIHEATFGLADAINAALDAAERKGKPDD